MLFRVLIILVICCLGFNFHLGGQSPTIYISELLTSNDFSITDEYGELEDWIEIHNHGSEVVDLKGMFLSDDENDPYKFEIQETILISPDDYILLWADGTPSQGVNHLNFKLSNGESLVFSSVDGIIDLISIENQRHNV
ncbi:MAG: lamin tail domain-containing protein, partial [Saprospiraceae bacterium]|nr:lamin tail domain-containing protein [Bacteroidia bacterium]NNL93168.1 lamin tail domain-containing protein [Saprospiraceae bacterium]